MSLISIPVVDKAAGATAEVYARIEKAAGHPLRSACTAGIAAGLLLTACQSADHGDDLAKPPVTHNSNSAPTASSNIAPAAHLTYEPYKIW
jgi:hypothetical protein